MQALLKEVSKKTHLDCVSWLQKKRKSCFQSDLFRPKEKGPGYVVAPKGCNEGQGEVL